MSGKAKTFPRAFLCAQMIALITISMGLSAAYAQPADGAGNIEEDPPSDYLISKEGHRFRVRFDPVSRLWVGAAAAFTLSPENAIKPVFEANLGISYRAIYQWGKGNDAIIWQLDQRFLGGSVWPFLRRVRDIPALDAALYTVSLHRHDEHPRIVLPSSPPASVAFPFDVGFDAEAGRVYVPAFALPGAGHGGDVEMLRVSVLRATAFLDPWRSGKPGRSVEIGVGARYEVEPIARPSWEKPVFLHRVSPATTGSLRFRFQSTDGLFLLDMRGEVIPHWTSEGIWRTAGIGQLHLERTLIAINDQPVVLVFEGAYRRQPESGFIQAANEVRASLGITLNASLK